jgi:DNA-binding LacI/PurR family transcriptional regulator
MRAANVGDVARRASVSPSTVSNFLNGRFDRMQIATRGRIEVAISELGFTPNRVARQLKTGHASLIGLIVPTVANPFFGQLATAIQEAAQARGYQVLLYNSRRDAARELEFATELASFGVKGIISGSALLSNEHAPALAAKGLSIVAFDGHQKALDDPRVHVVSLDNEMATEIAVDHLVALGHSRIVYVTAPALIVSRVARLAGFHAAVERHGIAATCSPYEIVLGAEQYGDDSIGELGQQAALDIIEGPLWPTAIVAMNDILAIGVASGLYEKGIPNDISLVGIDDLFLSSLMNPPLTTVRQPFQQLAAAAVESVACRIEGREQELNGRGRIFAPQLVTRKSTAHRVKIDE